MAQRRLVAASDVGGHRELIEENHLRRSFRTLTLLDRAALVNGRDHLHLAAFRAGFDPESARRDVMDLDAMLEEDTAEPEPEPPAATTRPLTRTLANWPGRNSFSGLGKLA